MKNAQLLIMVVFPAIKALISKNDLIIINSFPNKFDSIVGVSFSSIFQGRDLFSGIEFEHFRDSSDISFILHLQKGKYQIEEPEKVSKLTTYDDENKLLYLEIYNFINILTKKRDMNILQKTALILVIIAMSSSVFNTENDTISLTVSAIGLKNADGVVQFSLYNKDGSIPDEHYKKFYKQLTAKIIDNSSTVTFQNLPKGTYAVNILHDEDENGKLDKGWILPKEGVGFSNLKSISPLNRPNFKRTKFELDADKKVSVKMIYL